MNYFRVQSALMAGIQAVPVRVECAQSRRLPYLQILGGAGNSVGELRERVIAALGTLQEGKFRLPARRFTVQIVPGARNLPLDSLDLAVATAILGSVGVISAERLEKVLVWGALALDGGISSSGASLPIRRLLKETGCVSAILPIEKSDLLEKAQLERGGGFRTLDELVSHLRAGVRAGRRQSEAPAPDLQTASADRIWARISGQELGKRVIELSAAGAHHLILPGSSNARADLLAQALGLLLPPLGPRESEEVRGIYALAGPEDAPLPPVHQLGSRAGLPPLVHDRQARDVEEVLLAHHGVFFFDNACDRERRLFPRLAEAMSRGVLSTRLFERRAEIAVNTIVVAGTPVCACGARGDSRLACVCRPTEAKRFTARWRRLLRYPFDLGLGLAPEPVKSGGEGWRGPASRVRAARARMLDRRGVLNGRLGENETLEALNWGNRTRKLWEALEARAAGQRQSYLALARVSATISDLRCGAEISEADLHEALYFFPGGDAVAGPGRAERASIPAINSSAIP